MSTAPLQSGIGLPLRTSPGTPTLLRRLELPQYLPARMLNEYVYCPRLFFYEWVEGLFTHSGDTIEGALRHDTLGEKREALAPPTPGAEERIHSRSIALSSDATWLITSAQSSASQPTESHSIVFRVVDAASRAAPRRRVIRPS